MPTETALEPTAHLRRIFLTASTLREYQNTRIMEFLCKMVEESPSARGFHSIVARTMFRDIEELSAGDNLEVLVIDEIAAENRITRQTVLRELRLWLRRAGTDL